MSTTEKSFPTIGTHSGAFHCDEALACYLLRCTDEFKDSKVIRTRDSKVLDTLPILVDVGAVFDVKTKRFDHHQRGFFQTFSDNHKTKLSSAGLVYKYYGEEVIKNLVPEEAKEHLQTLYVKLYENFIEAIDGIDNGISQYPADIEPKYYIGTDLSARVGRLNPAWNEKDVDIMARFEQAIAMAGAEFTQAVNSAAKIWLPARSIVTDALNSRFKHDKSGEIVVFEDYTAWKGHLLQLEVELKVPTPTKYVLYLGGDQWRIQCVPERAGSFVSRLPLPEDWRGLRDQALSDKTGIADCVFIHPTGFIGGNKTFEGVLAMAKAALQLNRQDGESATKKPKISN